MVGETGSSLGYYRNEHSAECLHQRKNHLSYNLALHLWIIIEICLLHLVLKSASVLLPFECFDFFESEFRKLSAS